MLVSSVISCSDDVTALACSYSISDFFYNTVFYIFFTFDDNVPILILMMNKLQEIPIFVVLQNLKLPALSWTQKCKHIVCFMLVSVYVACTNLSQEKKCLNFVVVGGSACCNPI